MIPFLSIIAVGFFLGMRHATDPDHVIAVTTIVSQQNRLTRAALTGAFWGLGHSFTIFIIGTAIILFGLVIPVRVALSMELCVGLMLVSLGMIKELEVSREGKVSFTFELTTPACPVRDRFKSQAEDAVGFARLCRKKNYWD